MSQEPSLNWLTTEEAIELLKRKMGVDDEEAMELLEQLAAERPWACKELKEQ